MHASHFKAVFADRCYTSAVCKCVWPVYCSKNSHGYGMSYSFPEVSGTEIAYLLGWYLVCFKVVSVPTTAYFCHCPSGLDPKDFIKYRKIYMTPSSSSGLLGFTTDA